MLSQALTRPLYSPLSLGLQVVVSSLNATLGSKTGVEISTPTMSRKVYPSVSGAISITSGTGEYSINGSGIWVSVAGVLVDTDYFEARITSSGSYETPVALVFDIDGVTDTFTVTTKADISVSTPALREDGTPWLREDGTPAYREGDA